jgi:hypothetical protein
MGGVVKSVGRVLGIGGSEDIDVNGMKYNPNTAAYAANNKDQATQYQTVADAAKARAAGVNENDFRAKQTALAQALQDSANGVGPSIAQNQYQQNTNRNLNNLMALASSARGNTGANSALGMRTLLKTQADTSQQAAGDAANLKLQEQNQARQLLADVTGQGRGADQSTIANNTSQQMGAIGGVTGINEANRQAQENLESTRAGISNNAMSAAVSNNNAQRQQDMQITGGLMSGGASFLASGAKGKYKGGIVEGEAQVPGDSPENDTKLEALSPDEIVIPRSIVKSKNAPDKAKAFMEALAEKHPDKIGKDEAPKKDDAVGFKAILEAHRALLNHLEPKGKK